MTETIPESEQVRRLTEIQKRLEEAGAVAAAALARQELEAGLEHPLTLNLAAYGHECAGEYAAAHALLERARALAPHDVLIINSIGLLLARQDRRVEALETFDQALAIWPEFPQGHYSKAQSLEVVGEDEAAMHHYQRAIQSHPRYVEAIASMAQLAIRRGELDLADRTVRLALVFGPTEPMTMLAKAQLELACDNFAAAEADARRLLEAVNVDPADRPAVWTFLGDALDGQDRPAEAFAAYAEGKAEAARQNAGRFAAPGVESSVDYVRRLTEAVRASPPAAAQAAPPPAAGQARGHVFLLGFPRSGTTLLERVLLGHPDVETLDERDLLVDAEAELLRPEGGLAALAALAPDQIAAWRERYWKAAASLGRAAEGKVLVDKLPLHTIKLPLIMRLFPDAKILFALRDPRDVVLSCFRRNFRMNQAMYEFTDIGRAARFYDAVMTLGELCREAAPQAFATARYESLVADFEPEVARLCEFMGVEPGADLKDFAEAAGERSIRTPSAGQVRRGLYDTAVGQWRRYQGQLEPVLGLLEPWVGRFGYGGAETGGA